MKDTSEVESKTDDDETSTSNIKIAPLNTTSPEKQGRIKLDLKEKSKHAHLESPELNTHQAKHPQLHQHVPVEKNRFETKQKVADLTTTKEKFSYTNPQTYTEDNSASDTLETQSPNISDTEEIQHHAKELNLIPDISKKVKVT